MKDVVYHHAVGVVVMRELMLGMLLAIIVMHIVVVHVIVHVIVVPIIVVVMLFVIVGSIGCWSCVQLNDFLALVFRNSYPQILLVSLFSSSPRVAVVIIIVVVVAIVIGAVSM